MLRRIFLKVVNIVSVVCMVICVMFAISGGGVMRLIPLDFTGVPRVVFIAGAIVFTILSIVSEFYGKIAGNR